MVCFVKFVGILGLFGWLRVNVFELVFINKLFECLW